MSKFLNDLLAPIFLRVAHATTFINSIDLVRALERYVSDGRLNAATLFVTFDVADLYIMIPRNGALETLMRFLETNLEHGKIGTLSINDIMQMTRLVLNNNWFAYEGKYYRQVRGGAMGSAFTQTLANIYMLEWEHALVNHQHSSHELYGRSVLRAKNRSIHSVRTKTNSGFRYIDDIFMTTNLLPTQIEDLLRSASERIQTFVFRT